MTEYVIWGQVNPQEPETILCTKIEGEAITKKDDAEKISNLLNLKYNCINIRIQQIELTEPQSINKLFLKSINI